MTTPPTIKPPASRQARNRVLYRLEAFADVLVLVEHLDAEDRKAVGPRLDEAAAAIDAARHQLRAANLEHQAVSRARGEIRAEALERSAKAGTVTP